MSGEDVVREIRQLDPDVQILLQTGYSGEKRPLEILQEPEIQGYHDKADGPTRLLLWVAEALRAASHIKKVKETEQEQAKMVAREQLKDELMSVVSHELRTPLTSLRGFAGLMLTRNFPEEERRKFLNIILTESIRLAELINDFLDLRRMEEGRQGYDFTSVDMTQLPQDVAAVFSQDGSAHTLLLDVQEQLPPTHIDADRLRQALTNLLSNAVKFSPQGGEIRIEARRDGEQVIVAVKDSGIGITPENTKTLFQKLFRVDNAETRGINGTGLGLALVKEILEAHNGRVWIESEFGVGSTFFFSVPIAQVEQAAA